MPTPPLSRPFANVSAGFGGDGGLRAAAAPSQFFDNRLLAALPHADLEVLLPFAERVALPAGCALHDMGGRLEHVYFPTRGAVALLYVTMGGECAELALVGSEGMVGATFLMNGEPTPSRAAVQSAGEAYRFPLRPVRERFARGGPFQLLILRYMQALFTQISLTAVCNLHHSLEQQLCRWLLLTLDRVQDSQLRMTQELIATMLGVRRQGVTEALGQLDKGGIVRCMRGRIAVLDRPALERRVCECYGVVRRETDRLLPPAP